MNNLVSILIPVYNRFDLCDQAIQSALSQTYSNIEIIVGDNCSTDNTFDRLKDKYMNEERVILFRNDINVGPVFNWIECLKRAKGELVKFLWSDDLMHPLFLEETVTAFSDPEIAFAYSRVGFFSESTNSFEAKEGYRLGKTGVYTADKFFDALIKDGNAPFSPGCAIFRKSALDIVYDFEGSEEVGVLKTGAGVDLLMFLHALQVSNKFFFVNRTLSFFRVHKGSISLIDGSVPKAYICAEKFFFEFVNKIEYLKWIKAYNNVRAFRRQYSEEMVEYCKSIDMLGPEILLIFIYCKIIIRSLKRKIKKLYVKET